jgi:3-hydroxyisobutyrate dehydrogenase
MQTCDVVITMLSNDEAVKSFENENGLLSQDNPGKLIINMVPFLLRLLAI